jgi:hypothetical protein
VDVAFGVGLGVTTEWVGLAVGDGLGDGVDVCVGCGRGDDECVGAELGGIGPSGDADGLAAVFRGVAAASDCTLLLPPEEIAPATATPAMATPATARTVRATPRSPARAMNPRRRGGRRPGRGRPPPFGRALPPTSCRRRDIARPPRKP